MLKYSLLLALSFAAFSLTAQDIPNDTIALFHDGQISCHYKKIIRDKKYNNKTVLLQQKFESGEMSKEFVRYDDSSFLYTEYADLPKTRPVHHRDGYGKLREGVLRISPFVVGEEKLYYYAETYQSIPYMDTILMPVGEWVFWHPEGGRKMKGSFSFHGKQGEWIFYNNLSKGLNTKIVYEKNEIVSIEHVNIILDEDILKTQLYLTNTWKIHPFTDGTYRGMMLDEENLRAAEGLQKAILSKDGSLEFYDWDRDQRKHVPGKSGTWELTKYNELMFNTDDAIEFFEINSLSDKFFTFIILKD